jgi:hypothetical protein
MIDQESMTVQLVTSEYECGECGRPHQYDSPLFYQHRDSAITNVRFIYEEVK